jgi:hypothetical protein
MILPALLPLSTLPCNPDFCGLFGYIDPGILSMALQALFLFIFGAITAYLMAPWKWLTSLVRRTKRPSDEETASEPSDGGPSPVEEGDRPPAEPKASS